MEIPKANKPIFIVGCTRSGTKLVSRLIGGQADNFLITEHREKFHIPEDKSGVCEEHLWWNNFAFKLWGKDGNPIVRTPEYNESDIAQLKNIFLSLAGDKRLIVKNPQNILRIKFLKKMFPDALYIFCVRNPWHSLQSRVIGGQPKYLIGSQKNLELPDDLLLKSVYSWQESIDIYQEGKDDNWHVVRYEDMVFKPKETIGALFNFLGMDTHGEYFTKACAIPRDLEHTYYPIKRAFHKSRYQKEIMDIVEAGCAVFPYEASIDSVPGNAWHYYLAEKKYVDFKKIKSWTTKLGKKLIKKIVRLIFYTTGGAKKLYVSPLVFGALSQGGSTLITDNDDKLKNIVTHAQKGERVSFNALQMQYQRLRHYNKVIVMDSRGQPWLLLDNIAFSPAHRYDYTLLGEVEFIKYA